MDARQSVDLDLNIARARTMLAPATIVSIYLDPARPDLTPWFQLTGGTLDIDRYALIVLFVHALYSVAVHSAVRLKVFGSASAIASEIADVLFAIAIAIFTEGPTSPSYAFFGFAIVAAACRDGFRETLLVAGASVVAYLALILMSAGGEAHHYLMRPVYLGITGYLIAFLGQQRINFEARVRELETTAARQSIARALHDGYVQALAAVSLRLSACRRLLEKGRVAAAATEIEDLERGVEREYDEVRSYIRSLVHLEEAPRRGPGSADTSFHVQADFSTSGARTEQVLRIVLEAVRNTLQHARADTAAIRASMGGGALHIRIEDDGVGFPEGAQPPWSIASRVSELGGRISVAAAAGSGTELRIELPGPAS